jgi:hypothetical protein
MKHHVSPMTVYPVCALYRMCSVLSIECVLDMKHRVSLMTVCVVSNISVWGGKKSVYNDYVE